MTDHAQRRLPLEQVQLCVSAIGAHSRAACHEARLQIEDWELKLPLMHGYLFDSFNQSCESDVLRYCQNLCYMTNNKHLLQLTNHDQLKLIHLAARNGFIDVIKYLFSIGEDIDTLGPNHLTALWSACRHNKPNTVAYLLTQNATMINWQCQQTRREITAQQVATIYKHHRVLDAMTQHAPQRI